VSVSSKEGPPICKWFKLGTDTTLSVAVDMSLVVNIKLAVEDGPVGPIGPVGPVGIGTKGTPASVMVSVTTKSLVYKSKNGPPVILGLTIRERIDIIIFLNENLIIEF
jgi:hypothetical protein